ncbi:hypothetical protein FSARC_372 [Fusarium sarcochroum]|uniref:NmrA-like domain-containing protein n=1 Tax=Fusarium sarcochroum TaxID=1208366 RepID=A0A8H4UBE8_9HYPO|nr:hypothetical protein FSARC_372 [Fusarium sarcochroum]
MASKAQGRKIAIIGASGHVGAPALKTLLAQGVHTITAVQRAEATSTIPSEVIVKTGNLEDESFLASAFQGQDVVVLAPPLPYIISIQEPAVRAAAKAGVPYILPAEFGPDPLAKWLIEENQLLQNKKKMRDLIEELGVSSWISITVGAFLDANIQAGFWSIDAKNKKATIYSGANGKLSTSSVAHTGQAAAAVLSLPEDDLAKYKNKPFYVPAFRLTQREVLKAVQGATKTTDEDWKIVVQDIKDAFADCNAKIQQQDPLAGYFKFFLTHYQDDGGADFEHKVVASEVKKLHALGLQEESLEDVIKGSV